MVNECGQSLISQKLSEKGLKWSFFSQIVMKPISVYVYDIIMLASTMVLDIKHLFPLKASLKFDFDSNLFKF